MAWQKARDQRAMDVAEFVKATQAAQAREDAVKMPTMDDVIKRLDDGTA